MKSLSMMQSRRMDVGFTNPRPPFPREVFFDLNNTCNSRCYFCGNSKIMSRCHLDQKLGFRLLKEFYQFGTREAAFSATGEPFLRDDLSDFIRDSKNIGYHYVFLNSNGILATPERARPVLDAGLDSIKFSVNAGTRETYKRIHGVDCFDRVIENIHWFHRYRETKALSFRIYVSMVPTKHSKDEWPILQDLLKNFVDEMDLRGCSNQGGNMIENNMTEDIDKRNLLGSLKHNQFIGRCPDIFSRCTVTPQGYLTACVVDYQNYLVVADLNKNSVKDAWNNDLYVALRKRHMAGDIKGLMCYNCLNNCDSVVLPLTLQYAIPFSKRNGGGKGG